MIRHSSSFFLSLLLHGALVFLLLFAWQNMPSIKKVDCEKKMSIQLCNVVYKKPVVIPKPKPKPKPKPIPKQIIKKEVKKTVPVVKEVLEIKEEPVVVAEIIPEVVISEVEEVQKIEPKEEIVEEVSIVDQVTYREPVDEPEVESPQLKQERLEQEYLQEHIAQIIKLLSDNLYYPRRARKRGITGEVMVKFRLSTDAIAHSIEIVSSKHEILSRAAIKTIEDLSGEFPKPSEELLLHVPISYNLN